MLNLPQNTPKSWLKYTIPAAQRIMQRPLIGHGADPTLKDKVLGGVDDAGQEFYVERTAADLADERKHTGLATELRQQEVQRQRVPGAVTVTAFRRDFPVGGLDEPSDDEGVYSPLAGPAPRAGTRVHPEDREDVKERVETPSTTDKDGLSSDRSSPGTSPHHPAHLHRSVSWSAGIRAEQALQRTMSV